MFLFSKIKEKKEAERLKKMNQYNYIKKSIISEIVRLTGVEESLIDYYNDYHPFTFYEDDKTICNIQYRHSYKSDPYFKEVVDGVIYVYKIHKAPSKYTMYVETDEEYYARIDDEDRRRRRRR